MIKKTQYNEFKYKDTDMPYNGYYTQIKGHYYSGKTYVVGKSKEIVRIEKDDNKQLGIYPYAMIHKQFIANMQQPVLQLIMHPRKYSQSQEIITVYILQRKRDGKLYEVTKNCFNKLSSLRSPIYNYFELKLKITGSPYQMALYNNKSLFSVNSYNVVQFVKKLYSV